MSSWCDYRDSLAVRLKNNVRCFRHKNLKLHTKNRIDLILFPTYFFQNNGMFKRSLTTEAFDAVSVEQKNINLTTQHSVSLINKFLSIYSVPANLALSVGVIFMLFYLISEQADQAELLAKNDRVHLSEIQALKTQLLSQPVRAELQNEVLPKPLLSIIYLGHIQLNHLSKALVELDGEQMLVMPGQILKLDWQIKELNEQYLLLESKDGRVMRTFREGP